MVQMTISIFLIYDHYLERMLMHIYPNILQRLHSSSTYGWPKPAADSYPLAMEHLESRIATRVHSSARPLTVSFLPNPANHKRIRLNGLFHLFWRAQEYAKS
jgi:hypothetical protein